MATDKVKLYDIMMPLQMRVDNNYLYVSDSVCHCVLIYSLDNFRFIRKIGKKGEGPGETKIHFGFEIYQNNILLWTINKFIIYSKQGKIIRERLIPPNLAILELNIVNNNFILYRSALRFDNTKLKKHYCEIDIYDQNFKKIKTLLEFNHRDINLQRTGKNLDMFPLGPPRKFQIWSDHIYLANSAKGLYIEVFDSR
jgi:hypothetical protein